MMSLPKDSNSEDPELMTKVLGTLDHSQKLIDKINKMVSEQEIANEAAAQRKIQAYGAKLMAEMEHKSGSNQEPVAQTKKRSEEEFEAFKIHEGLDMKIYGAKAMEALEATVRKKRAHINNLIDVHRELVANFEFEKNSRRLDEEEEREMAEELNKIEKNKLNPAKSEYQKLANDLIKRQEYAENLWDGRFLKNMKGLKEKLNEHLKELEAIKNSHQTCEQITRWILDQDDDEYDEEIAKLKKNCQLR